MTFICIKLNMMVPELFGRGFGCAVNDVTYVMSLNTTKEKKQSTTLKSHL